MFYTQIVEFFSNFHVDQVFLWLAPLAYQPYKIYLLVLVMMMASSVGFPLPEEVTLISVGLVAYTGHHPSEYPPPYPGAVAINAWNAAIVCFVIVVSCDFFIYTMGKFFGRKIVKSKRFTSVVSVATMNKIENWTQKYGLWAVGLFRFTPGVRFPGHIACGILNIPAWKFLAIDGIAAAISVPTQIVLVGLYGKPILGLLKEFKIIVFTAVGIILAAILFRRILNKVVNNRKKVSER